MDTDKEQTAMERLRLASDMSLKLYKRPLLLTDSGGKDSAVICKLAENAGIPFEICHSHTTADAPETVYHVRKRAKEYEEKCIKYTIILPTYQGKRTSMWDLIPKKLVPPMRVARYCCAILKETAGKWFHKYIYGKAEIRFVRGRLKFGGAAWNAPFPSMVVIFRRKRGFTWKWRNRHGI